MYTNLEVLKVESIVYVLLFLGRRLIFAYQIAFCSGFVVGQIAINIYSTSIMLQYLVSVQPMRGRIFNWIQIFNEFVLLILAGSLFMFTDFVQEASYRYDFGYFFLGFIAFNVAVNVGVMVYCAIMDAIKAFKKWQH